ncbi:MAG: anti-sigma-I factor RsgI family protein [Christensenellaceae bacterium]|jgi:hypothetical protein
MKYLVMETHKSYSVVIDEAGRFLRAANLGYQQGQYIDEVILLEDKKASTRIRTITTIGTAIAACFIFLFVALFSKGLEPTYASFYLSINPQVRIDVTEKGKVKEIEALNDDGKQLLQQYSYQKKDILVVTDELLERAISFGLLKDGGVVQLDIDAPEEAWFVEKGIALRMEIEEYLQGKVAAEIVIRKFGDVSQDPIEKDMLEEESVPSEETTPTPEDTEKEEEKTTKAPAPSNSRAPENQPKEKETTPAPEKPIVKPNDDWDDDDDRDDDDDDWDDDDNDDDDWDDDNDDDNDDDD